MEIRMVNDKKMEISVNSSGTELVYGWKDEKYRTILNLGRMRNAVIIHHSYIGNYFKIGEASFFPFNDEIYGAKYDSIEQAKNVASTYILEWFGETKIALNI